MTTSERRRRGTCYLSGKMSGLPDHGAAAFTEGELLLREVGWEVINPLTCWKPNGIATDGGDWEEHLRWDLIAMLSKCEAVVTLNNWRYSRGAKLEVATAAAIGMPRYTLYQALGRTRRPSRLRLAS
jgi:Domain of unknown function (DUF4406)